MVYIGRCIPCQYGAHEDHREVIQAVPEGMIGGAICGCKGECVDEYVPPRIIEAPPLTEKEKADWAEFERIAKACSDG